MVSPSTSEAVDLATQRLSIETTAVVDVVIVGRGASGLAVAIQLLERIKQGKGIKSITMIEKRESVGPGLAYSEECAGSIVNMDSDTMGLCPVNPMQFTEWVREVSPKLQTVPFPSRQQYGEYLKKLLENVLEDAKTLGIKFDIINDEARDLPGVGDIFELALFKGNVIRARKVVLSIGNFSATSHPELSPNDSYLKCPWPNEKLKVIPVDASISILGSRLTAIDVVNSLVDNGHQGSITLISRSGRLPKVQGPGAVYPRRYALYSLAKNIEAHPKNTLQRVMGFFKAELEAIDVTNFSGLAASHHPLATLHSDIAQAEKGPIPWQAILIATKAVIECYWKCSSSSEKLRCLRFYNSIWINYRHAIPLENTRKILILLEMGQLKVVRGSEIRFNDSEFILSSAEPELLQRCLAAGLLEPHPTGGIKVDFSTLKATENVYVVGSLTNCIHFYTTAIDRVVAHASRIADSLTGIPVRRSLHIAFFVGGELFSHLMLSKLVPQLLASGHMPFIFRLSDSINSKTKSCPFALQELSFFERTLLQDYVILFLGSNPTGASCLTVDQLTNRYGIMVERVRDINSKAFLQILKDNYMEIGISLRCYQKFGSEIIRYFSSPRALLNLHPGVLPQYCGVVTAIRAMMNGEKNFRYSLHHIDENFDTGDVIDIRTKPLDYKKSMLSGMDDIYDVGVGMILDAVEKFARGGDLHEGKVEQNENESKYYSFPTAEDLQKCRENGIRLVDGEEVQGLLVASFATKEIEKGLRVVIEQATRDWYQNFLDTKEREVLDCCFGLGPRKFSKVLAHRFN